MRVEPYLFFNGRCEEAIEFYRGAVHAEVVALTHTNHEKSSVQHAHLRVGDTAVMASDGQSQSAPSFHGFSLALTLEKNADADRIFYALSDGGKIQVPMMTTPFATRFGMTTDRFGVSWTVSANEA